jgi:penicillin-binding protein 2
VLGHLAHVNKKDMDEKKLPDELHSYQRNDLIGKTGVEALCEPALRGTRGKIERVQGEDAIVAGKEPIAGSDVRLTLDIELQQRIQAAFMQAQLRDTKTGEVKKLPDGTPLDHELLHGAAVVLDINTNEVLAMVSYPTYDENKFDELYASLRDDEVNDPLANRATTSQLEPGSTMKPFCGLAGISQGVIGVNDGIECTGFLVLDGRKIDYGRCWVESRWGKYLRERNMSAAHHPIPSPHVGHDGNPDGFLTYSDALERSCNVYFETVADRLGIERLSDSYRRFGFGRPTGIGIGEAYGRLPSSYHDIVPGLRRSIGFYGGIGQGWIAATPIQMANGAAMIARNGIWMRPRLVLPGADGNLPPLRKGDWQKVPDRVDLNLPPEALAAARLGMFNVVNSPNGTGEGLVKGDFQLEKLGICGKTGTAQAARFSVILRDEKGKPLRINRFDDAFSIRRSKVSQIPKRPGIAERLLTETCNSITRGTSVLRRPIIPGSRLR